MPSTVPAVNFNFFIFFNGELSLHFSTYFRPRLVQVVQFFLQNLCIVCFLFFLIKPNLELACLPWKKIIICYCNFYQGSGANEMFIYLLTIIPNTNYFYVVFLTIASYPMRMNKLWKITIISRGLRQFPFSSVHIYNYNYFVLNIPKYSRQNKLLNLVLGILASFPAIVLESSFDNR